MQRKLNRKHIQQWLALLVPLVIVGGHFWPYFGFIAIAMLALMVVLALFRGRYYCGWFCAMGAFHERVLSLVSLKQPMLPVFKQAWFKWIMFVLMMGLLSSRLILSGGDPARIAATFVMMWTLATGLAIALGLVWKPRSWCSICPMGTFQGLISQRTYQLQVGEACRECGLCREACPIETYAGASRAEGVVASRDCMRCGNCVVTCPQRALSFLEKAEKRSCRTTGPPGHMSPV